MKCIRCGQCCIHSPCWWAQIEYGYNKENYKVCQDLVHNADDSYTCKMFSRNEAMRHEMLNRGCFYPEWRKERVIKVFGQEWQTVNTEEGKRC